MKVHIHDLANGKEYVIDWHTAVVPRWTSRQQPLPNEMMVGLPDNGALISCGLTVGWSLDGVTPPQLRHLIETGQATEVPAERRGHGGCLSSCVLKGHDRCSW